MSIKKFALIGKDISHSKSPELQKKIWGDELISYDLIDIQNSTDLPTLQSLVGQYIGVNITTPFKEAYLSEVKIESDIAREVGAINTISLKDFSAINTDVVGVENILKHYLQLKPGLRIHLLGSGVMARMTLLVTKALRIECTQYSRFTHGDLCSLDLMNLDENDLVINSCSRSFIYRGEISDRCHFWDYNYAFPEHDYLRNKVKSYQDGQGLLWEQANAAAEFWRQKTKLNY